MTYPIKGYPWRHNPFRSYELSLSAEEANELFDEVSMMQKRFPNQCLDNEELWSDASEKANGITRHRKTGKLCYTIAIYRAPGEATVYFSMEEDSLALRDSRIYRTISGLIAAYEVLRTPEK